MNQDEPRAQNPQHHSHGYAIGTGDFAKAVAPYQDSTGTQWQIGQIRQVLMWIAAVIVAARTYVKIYKLSLGSLFWWTWKFSLQE